MEENSKEIYEQKKAERKQKKEERKNTYNPKKNSKATVYAMWIVLAVLVGYGLFALLQKAGPQSEDFSVKYDIQGRQHIAEGTDHPAYNSNPPSSGWHYTSTVKGGFHSDPLEDERVIHNLEHGDIWIAYHPDINEEALETLKSFAGQYVIVSPRTENEGDMSLVAWGRVDTFDVENDEVDEQRIRDFIKRYDNRGPEKVRGI